jgi:hypothetical protein
MYSPRYSFRTPSEVLLYAAKKKTSSLINSIVILPNSTRKSTESGRTLSEKCGARCHSGPRSHEKFRIGISARESILSTRRNPRHEFQATNGHKEYCPRCRGALLSKGWKDRKTVTDYNCQMRCFAESHHAPILPPYREKFTSPAGSGHEMYVELSCLEEATRHQFISTSKSSRTNRKRTNS